MGARGGEDGGGRGGRLRARDGAGEGGALLRGTGFGGVIGDGDGGLDGRLPEEMHGEQPGLFAGGEGPRAVLRAARRRGGARAGGMQIETEPAEVDAEHLEAVSNAHVAPHDVGEGLGGGAGVEKNDLLEAGQADALENAFDEVVGGFEVEGEGGVGKGLGEEAEGRGDEQAGAQAGDPGRLVENGRADGFLDIEAQAQAPIGKAV